MGIKKLKEKLQDLFEANKVKTALSLLKKELDREREKYTQFLSLSRRFNQVQDQRMANTIDFNNGNIELNKIGGAILDFIETLDSSDLGQASQFVHLEVLNEIVVFSKIDKAEKVKFFFNQLNFSNISVHSIEEFKNVDYDQFDLIIFDNRDIPPCFSKNKLEELDKEIKTLLLQRIEIMESVIKDSSKFIIHYGEFLYWLNFNRERIQAANSQFSLYARTKEVIEFVNTYRI
ncbi:MAG: hypothetical protein AB8E82_08850 [Aureispira sp.]